VEDGIERRERLMSPFNPGGNFRKALKDSKKKKKTVKLIKRHH